MNNHDSEPTMQEAQTKNPFFDFNIGHMLTLITMVGVGVGIYVNNEKTITRFETRIEAHAATLAAFSARFERLETLGGLASVDHKLTVGLVDKVDNHTEKLTRLEVIASDISQIKGELMRRSTGGRE